jgi:predicted Zn-dependent protease
MAMRQWEKADVVLDGLCVCVPGWALAWLARATLAQAHRRHPHALQLLRTAQRRAPRSALLKAHLGEALLNRGRPGEARREFEGAQRLGLRAPAAQWVDARLAALRHP